MDGFIERQISVLRQALRHNFARVVSNQLVYGTSDTPISGVSLANHADIIALNATTNNGLALIAQDYGEAGLLYRAIGGAWKCPWDMLGFYASNKTYTFPSTGVTWQAAAYNGSGKVRLNTVGAVAHGLTAANSDGAYITITAGTGWSSTTEAAVTYVDADTIDLLDVNFASQGAPTIADAGDEKIIDAFSVPPIVNGKAAIFADVTYANKAVLAGARDMVFRHTDGVTNVDYHDVSLNSGTNQVWSGRTGFALQDGSLTTQRGFFTATSASGSGSNASAAQTGDRNMGAATTVQLVLQSSAADAPSGIRHAFIFFMDV